MAEPSDVVIRHVDRNELERRSRPESHKGNLKRLKTNSSGGFERWEKENELLWAMLEDETDWLAKLFPDIVITPELFFYALEDGVVLCRLANLIQETAEDYGRKNKVKVPSKRFKFHTSIQKKNKQLALFKSRENVQGFLTWCRQIGISDSILFESNDVVEADECREGCREVVICLMEIARRASGAFKFTPIPKLIQLEKEIEIEEQEEAEETLLDEVDYGSSDEESNTSNTSCPSPEARSPPTHDDGHHPSPKGNKKKSKRHQPKSELDHEVLKIIDNFNVYNIRKIKEGKYMILGKIIFVRMLNGHVLLRIGGGWDTLEHYLLTHLPKAAASENGHSSTEATVSPSVSKTPQKSQLTKILDKVKKEQKLKVTPSPYRTAAGKSGNKSKDEDDEKDITSAIRKIEFSVNQNIATRRKTSKHSQEATPQKSPSFGEDANPNTPSDINQNNITDKVSKSRSPKVKGMENEENIFNDHNGDVCNSEQQNGEGLNFEGAAVKPLINPEGFVSSEPSDTTEDIPDVVDGAVLAKLNTESAGGTNEAEEEEPKQIVDEIGSSDSEQSSDHPEISQENSDEPFAQHPAEAVTESLDVLPNESELAKNDNDVPPNDSEASASAGEVEVPPIDASVPASDARDLPNDGEVPPTGPPVIPDDSKTSESPSPAPESTSSASTSPDIPQSPQKAPSDSAKKDGVESPKKKTDKASKDSAKTKAAGSKAPGKKEAGSTVGSRPKSAKPSARATADSAAAKNTKRPVSAAAKSSTTTAARSTTTATAKTRPTVGKTSTTTAKTKAPPSGKTATTKTTGGKISPTHAKRPTTKPDPKATPATKPDPKAAPSTRPARPTKTTAFGSTVATTAAKKPAPRTTRPVTAPPARSTTTQAKRKPVAAKVQSWSSSAARPQSAKPSSKPKDSTDGGAASRETGSERPTSPTKPLVRKTQTRTMMTTKTTRVGAGGEPEIKSQTLKTTRTVTEANGKKTTKTTVKEVSPTGRKPLRMKTEKTEGGTGDKKPAKAATDSKTGTRTAKPGTKKPETKTGPKSGPSRPSKETGTKKAPTKTASKTKEVKAEIKEVPKAKTVKELSNALGITKPSDEKEKKGEKIEAEPEEIAKQEVEEPKPAEMPELAPAKTEESPPQVEESVQVEESPEVEVSPEAEAISSPEPSAEEPTQERGGTGFDQVEESGIANVECGIEEVSHGHEGIRDSSEDTTEDIRGESVQRESNEITESARDLESEQKQEIDHEVMDEQPTGIVSDANVEQATEDITTEKKTTEHESVEQVEENEDEVGEKFASNDDESGEAVTDFGHVTTSTDAHEEVTDLDSPALRDSSEALIPGSPDLQETSEAFVQDSSEVIVQDSPEPRNSSGIDDSLEDDSLDVIVVPESDVSHDESALQSTEAWPAVSVGNEHAQDVDLLGDNNNEAEETGSKLDPCLIPSSADSEEPADSAAGQNLLDFSADEKAESWFNEDAENTGEPTDRDSGFQENHTVDDLLG